MLKDAYYFSHDANSQDDPKCMVLIDQLGMEGYGIFWALIEKLRGEKNYILPMTVIPSLAKRWSCRREKVLAVVSNFDLFVLTEDGKFYSQRLRDSMTKKAESARKSVSFRWQPDTTVIRADTTDIRPDTNLIRTDTIKGKESKEDSNTNSSINSNAIDGIFPELGEAEKKEWEKFEKWAVKNTPKLFKMKWPLLPKQLFLLRKKFKPATLLDVMLAMENTKPLLKKYESAYLTIKSWCRRREEEKDQPVEEIGGNRLKTL